MNNFKYLLTVLIACCFLSANVAAAQEETPAKPKSEKNPPSEKQKPDQPEKDQKSDDKKSDDKPGEKQAKDQKPAGSKAKDQPGSDDEAGDEQDDADDEQDDAGDDQGEDNEDEAGSSNSAFSNWFNSSRSRDVKRLDQFSKSSENFVTVFNPVVASANESTLTIVSGKRQIALGTVVDSNGLILTKASELRGKIGAKLYDGTIVGAEVIGIDTDTDLALLKVDAQNLNVPLWSDEPNPVIGQWVASPKANRGETMVGVVSVDVRKIPPSSPFIGIEMDPTFEDPGVLVKNITERSPAASSGLETEDVITKLDDTEVNKPEDVREALKQYDPNDDIVLSVTRGEKELKINLTLADRDKVVPTNLRSNQQNSMGSILSKRRKDFPEAFQHDSMLNSNTCGGPIVDLSGKIVGINIARAGRVSSLALTVATVRPILERMKTGELAPAIVNRAKIEQVESELKTTSKKLAPMPRKKSVLEKKYNIENARLEEIEKTMAQLKKRLDEVKEKTDDYKSELDSVTRSIRSQERRIQQLESDRKLLTTGSK